MTENIYFRLTRKIIGFHSQVLFYTDGFKDYELTVSLKDFGPVNHFKAQYPGCTRTVH